MTGQGYDCQFGISGSYSGFGTILPKSRKHGRTAKKKFLVNGVGTTVGYKYFDPEETLTLEFEIASTSGNTGTVQATLPAIGTTITASDPVYLQGTGSFSLDKWDTSVVPGEGLIATVEMSRFDGTPVS